jgi:hypothetical protein
MPEAIHSYEGTREVNTLIVERAITASDTFVSNASTPGKIGERVGNRRCHAADPSSHYAT